MPNKIAAWPYGGPEGYERLLISQALIRTVSEGDLETKLPSFSAVRRIAAELRRNDAKKLAYSDTELLSLAEEEIDELRRTLDEEKATNVGLLQVAEEERTQALEANEQARLANAHLRIRIAQLESSSSSAANSRPPSIPSDFSDFNEWCIRNLSGQVELHNRALQGVKKSQLEDVGLVYGALLALRDAYVPMRKEGGPARLADFEAACGRLGISEEPTISETRAGEEGDTYYVDLLAVV